MKTLIKKLGITLALLTVIVLVVAYAGKNMIQSSPVYEISRLEVQNRYGANPADISIQFLRPFKFSEGESTGFAEFGLCDKNACYQVNAQKKSNTWRVTATKK